MILFNTAPFQATLLGYLVLGDKISRNEAICMCVAFLGVLVIALAKPIEQPDGSDQNRSFGILCSLTVSACFAVVNVWTRKMQAVHYSIVLFYYAVLAVPGMLLILWVETEIKDQALRVLTLSSEQIGIVLLASCFNAFGLVCHTIAMQNEKSGFISMLGYTAVCYSFLGDVFIFHLGFSAQELVGVAIVCLVIVYLVFTTFKPK